VFQTRPGIRAYITNDPARWTDDPEISRQRAVPKQGGFETPPLPVSGFVRLSHLFPQNLIGRAKIGATVNNIAIVSRAPS
jgi:hypothetical protein